MQSTVHQSHQSHSNHNHNPQVQQHHDGYAYNSLPLTASPHSPYSSSYTSSAHCPSNEGTNGLLPRSSATSATSNGPSSALSPSMVSAAAAAAAAAAAKSAAAYYYSPFTNSADPSLGSALHSHNESANSLLSLPIANGSAINNGNCSSGSISTNSSSSQSSGIVCDSNNTASDNHNHHSLLAESQQHVASNPMLIHHPVSHPISQDATLSSAHLSPQSGSLANTHSFAYSAQQSPGHSILGTAYGSEMGTSLSSSTSNRHFNSNDLLINHHSNHLTHLPSAATNHLLQQAQQPLSPQNVSTHSLSSSNSNCNEELAYQQLQTPIPGNYRFLPLFRSFFTRFD